MFKYFEEYETLPNHEIGREDTKKHSSVVSSELIISFIKFRSAVFIIIIIIVQMQRYSR